MYSLAEVLEWKYGAIAGTRQKISNDTSPNPEMVISEWNHSIIPQPDETQLQLDFAEYEVYIIAENQKAIANENANQALRDKHKDKKASELTKADVDEWNKQKTVEELGLEV